MKICLKCKIEKDSNFFCKDRNKKDGLNKYCKDCNKVYVENNKDKISIYGKNYRKKYSEKAKEYYQDYYDKNKNSILENNKKYYENNKESINLKSKKYREKNREKIKNKKKEYQHNNKEKIKEYRNSIKERLKEYNKKYYGNNREILNIKRNIKIKANPLEKLKANIRCVITTSFKVMKFKKSNLGETILGCSFEDLKQYLESKFEYWMNWENRGLYNGELNYGWDIDHIIPLSTAKSEDDLIKLNHYTNLQPLCSKINRDIKGNKVDYLFTQEFN